MHTVVPPVYYTTMPVRRITNSSTFRRHYKSNYCTDIMRFPSTHKLRAGVVKVDKADRLCEEVCIHLSPEILEEPSL